MRALVGRWVRRVATWLFRLGDWIEGAEEVMRVPINLEPEHALRALREAEEKLGREDRADG